MPPIPLVLLPVWLLVFIFGFVLRPADRNSWRREWLAEAWHRYSSLAREGEWNLRQCVYLYLCCAGCVRDAFAANPDLLLMGRPILRSPVTPIAVLTVSLALLAFITGLCPQSRTVFQPLPFSDADRLALVSRTGRLQSIRTGIPKWLAKKWTAESPLLLGAALYSGPASSTIRTDDTQFKTSTLVSSSNLFQVLNTSCGASCIPDNEDVVLSYRFWREHFANTSTPGKIRLFRGEKRLNVIGVLPPSIWFLSPKIDLYRLDSAALSEQPSILVRMRSDTNAGAVQRDLALFASHHGEYFTLTAPDVLLLRDARRAPFLLFAAACLMSGLLVASPAVYMIRRSPRQRGSGIWWAFLFLKTGLALLVTFVAGTEMVVSRQTADQAMGGPALLWCLVMGSAAALALSVADQRKRCHICLRIMASPVRVGCPGFLFLDWSGTELLCPGGHGVLYVPHHVTCWERGDCWVPLNY